MQSSLIQINPRAVEYQIQNALGEVKYDAFPYLDTDAKSCEAKIDLSNIIKMNDLRREKRDNRFDFNQNIDKNEIFCGLLSDMHKDKQPSLMSLCEVEVSLSEFKEHKTLKDDLNTADFLDFTPPDSIPKPMKLKDISNCEGNEVLSDLLSPLTDNPSNLNSFHVSDDDFSLSDICIPELRKNETSTSSKQPNITKESSSDRISFDLSDILSSLSAGDGNQSKSNPLKNSTIDFSDQGLSFDDFKISNQVSRMEKNYSPKVNQENLSDIFSSLDISNLKSNKMDTSKKSKLSTIKLTDECSKIGQDDNLNEGFFSLIAPKNIPVQNRAKFDNFNIDELGKVSDKRKDEETQNKSPSNFSEFSFSHMLGKNSQSEATQEFYSSSGDSGISMMDFLSSTESSKENTSTSEDDLDKYSSPSLSSTPDDEGEELNAVDLNFCIKTVGNKLSEESTSPIDDYGSSHQMKGSENANFNSGINSLPLQHSVAPVIPLKRMKQSLFSKSFSCKSKKDPHLIHKIADIKAHLLNQAFGCSTPVNFHHKTPLPNPASFSENPITSYAGRKSFDSAGVSVVC